MKILIGVDEVGRGAWAGPMLVVAARATNSLPGNLKDSKLLSAKQREKLFQQLIDSCEFGEGWVQPEEIDGLGLAKAMRLGVSRSLIMLNASNGDEIIIDGGINYCPEEFVMAKSEVKADQNYPIVSAASIYAKVMRDRHMARLDKIYPDYGFKKHVGYGTQLHQIMLKNYGPSRIHRRSYKPIKALI